MALFVPHGPLRRLEKCGHKQKLSANLSIFGAVNSSLYIHIPFCKRLCGYCDFYKTMSLARKAEVVAALCHEMEQRAPMLHGTTLKTIYLGGGTPTVCTPDELAELLGCARRTFDCSEVEELTIEANPDDLTEEYLVALRALGFNRLSIGIQSFRDEDLRFMNRRHDAATAVAVVERARRCGFLNISIDLIYGLPTMDEEQWRENVRQAIALAPQHISAYHLTIEQNTLFGRRGITTAPEEVSDKEYAILCDELRGANYEHYEISNFALAGYHSRHNSAYWQGTPYLGIGPAAHSYDGAYTRSWNVANVAKYLDHTPAEEEHLSDQERYEEFLMVGLRTARGVSLRRLEELFGAERKARFMGLAQRQIELGAMQLREGWVSIVESDWLLSDCIISDFFD